MENNNIEYWQKMAGFYTPFMKNNKKMYEAICREVEPELNHEMTVLELACGTGQLSFPLAPKTAHWEATDFSEQMIKEAKKRVKSNKLFFSIVRFLLMLFCNNQLIVPLSLLLYFPVLHRLYRLKEFQ